MKNTNIIESDIFDIELTKKASNPDNCCGGPNGCINRSCDKSKPDCIECIADYDKAMEDLNEWN